MKKIQLFAVITVVLIMASCKDRDAGSSDNPLLAEWTTPFQIPPFDRIEVKHYEPAFATAMQKHLEEIDAITRNNELPGFENVILAYDNSGSLLEKVGNIFSLVSSADTNAEMQEAEERINPLLSAHNDDILMNEKLFEKVKSVYDRRAELGLNELQTRLLDKTYKKFIRSGADLSKEQKAELKQINQELASASFSFASNLLAENARFQMVLNDEDLTGLTFNIRNSAKQAAKEAGKDGKYVFTLARSSIFPFLSYSDRRDLREEIYTAYIQKCNHGDSLDNTGLVNDIIRLRTARAHLLGYNSHADFILENTMAKTPGNVYSLLDELWTPALNRAKAEMEDMREIKIKETGVGDFEAWDWWFYSEKVRKSKYNLDQETLRNYFAIDNVRQGIFELCNRLYGITFRPVIVPLYHEDCAAYEVIEADGSHVGVLIMDYFTRPSKRAGAWCGEYRRQSYENGRRIAPIITIVCNFAPPSSSTIPALLTLDDVETFFHEFGHALNFLFADVPYNGLYEVERDFVELPSQIMENWAVEPEMLRSYALHYNTGSIIPENLIKKIQESSTFNQGFATTELLAASLSDMDIHVKNEYQEFDVNEFEHDMLNVKRGLIPQIAPRYRYPYFLHIFDSGFSYSAGYYSYIWAEVLDKDAYQAFVESGDIFNKEIAKRFRTEVLSKGGMADGMTLYKNFRGQAPSRTPLLKARGLK